MFYFFLNVIIKYMDLDISPLMKKAAYFIITLEVTPPQKVANFLITLYSYDFFLVLHLMDNFGGITFLSVCI